MGERLPAGRGERRLVAPAEELVETFALTLDRQTRATYSRACKRFVRWLGPGAGPEA